MTKKEFFAEISKICNYMDESQVEAVYFAMLRTITRELREKKSIVLPRLGEFFLRLSKSRRSYDINNKTFFNSGPKMSMKFTPNRELRKYFHQIIEN